MSRSKQGRLIRDEVRNIKERPESGKFGDLIVMTLALILNKIREQFSAGL